MPVQGNLPLDRCLDLVRALNAPPLYVCLVCITEVPSADHPRFTEHWLTFFDASAPHSPGGRPGAPGGNAARARARPTLPLP